MIYKRRRICTIDIGTNAILFLIADRNETGNLKILRDESRIPKLGEGLRTTGKISDEAMVRAISVLKEYKSLAHQFEVQEIFITATSAAREASNKEQFLAKVLRETGMQIFLIPPNEEARLAYLSVASELLDKPSAMVVDIGGGSTEVTWGMGGRFDGGRSLNLGTVKLTEGYFQKQPPTAEDLEKARKEVDDRLSKITPLAKLERYFGTAGSFTHLASIDMEMKTYHPNNVAGYKITREIVAKWIERFSKMTKEEMTALPGLDARRVDVVFSGTIIIERLLNKFEIEAFEVMDRGIRFGRLFDSLKGFTGPIEWDTNSIR